MGFQFVNKLPTPDEIREQFTVPPAVAAAKKIRDEEIKKVFTGESNKFIVVIGPCSADNEDSVCDYTRRLAPVQEKVKDKLIIIPRVYTNKPRTTGEGYKGMVHQPDPEKKPNMYEGILAIRRMHMRVIEETGLTTADEMLYPENLNYLSDLMSYIAVGARSVENQQHRLTVSGCEVPVGMKNPTSGDLSVMLNSVVAAQQGHDFIFRGWEVKTEGNPLESEKPGLHRGCQPLQFQQALSGTDPYRQRSASQQTPLLRTQQLCKGSDDRELYRAWQPESRRALLRKIDHRSLSGMGRFRTVDL